MQKSWEILSVSRSKLPCPSISLPQSKLLTLKVISKSNDWQRILGRKWNQKHQNSFPSHRQKLYWQNLFDVTIGNQKSVEGLELPGEDLEGKLKLILVIINSWHSSSYLTPHHRPQERPVHIILGQLVRQKQKRTVICALVAVCCCSFQGRHTDG